MHEDNTSRNIFTSAGDLLLAGVLCSQTFMTIKLVVILNQLNYYKPFSKIRAMSPTDSLRKDHVLIEKMINALRTMSTLLRNGNSIPPTILEQTIEFSTNFTNTCHHGKEEESLFPSLEKNGMPKEGGPIARMLYEHEITKTLTDNLRKSAELYISTHKSEELLSDIDKYINHVTLHLAKENQRLFVMADMLLAGQDETVTNDLENIEQVKLNSSKKTRKYYEDLVERITLQENSL
ncbi:hemerythrin domain-containing protein [Candidatus Nitrosocosmicus franklandus]|uniref:Hemerythrin HHE cation binding domain protein (Modular protein) n=1 Tax=Candidatus Nitrosocosmicus franklandianus TaxID=1798806 RepID=A0A484I4V8_9ARCH|nr:hemerythrin domain-containing protein [Candidatus Nitrosocosmicus franklandus]VFJ12695.1 Hemerythrin HHE cation binding domain protein (modular protein) [Candidatus Nitrosocosmicus franklandus]